MSTNGMASEGTTGAEGVDRQFGAPQITLPKGGGAIRGIDEKFTANPVTGTGAVSIALALSAGRAGFGPQLALNYDSGSGNVRWSRLFGQFFRFDEWNLCRG